MIHPWNKWWLKSVSWVHVIPKLLGNLTESKLVQGFRYDRLICYEQKLVSSVKKVTQILQDFVHQSLHAYGSRSPWHIQEANITLITAQLKTANKVHWISSREHRESCPSSPSFSRKSPTFWLRPLPLQMKIYVRIRGCEPHEMGDQPILQPVTHI